MDNTVIAAIGGAVTTLVTTVLAARIAPDSVGRLFTQLILAPQQRETSAVETLSKVLQNTLDKMGGTLDTAMTGWRESTNNFVRLAERLEGQERDELYHYQNLQKQADAGQAERKRAEGEIKGVLADIRESVSALVTILSKVE